ncbi:hypothetical protein GCM10008967_15850 [Bacillus carboniphilus]|uniref:Glycosyltransferase 2-like domain-containing protein n=1 Tax=Bacillus carboniphilus TaxID=86663 RepID=A0ABN0W5S4_9BACI
MKHYVIIIPALNPPESLVVYVQELLEHGSSHVIVVNDGSNLESNHIFNKLKHFKRCTVLTHGENKGKGCAIKTAFQYFLDHFHHMEAVITADADGQHSIEDVLKLAKVLEHKKEGLVCGVRNFKESFVPKRSLIGNRMTSFIFYLLFRIRLLDTQTGLRGFPKNELPSLIDLKGDRYEYEMNVLIYAATRRVPILEVPIQTLYFNQNKGSFFKPLRDSIRILHIILLGFFFQRRKYRRKE